MNGTPVRTDWKSPNHGDRKGRDVSMAVIHYTGMKSAKEALERLCDPEAQVSAHYVIEENGRTHQLVAEDRRAWHAGAGIWKGEADINSVSIGFELVNPGHEFGYREFPGEQIDALIDILEAVKARYNIPRARIIGHSDLAPDRKEDPGEKFPWRALAAEKLAFGPWTGERPEQLPTEEEAAAMLSKIGYGVEMFGVEPCVTAFQRRFAPRLLGQKLFDDTRSAIWEVHKRVTA
ncbi:N-acetylmuramoyl-L-alanine amidase [Parvularcula sp. ZS-1/3]|uniref:N-acetylmuramoyl-L-alanine amidase n=1 Tax=Parvularcula mediterranea TaxID=2732508 RepID=A0A7Y3RLS0_9PROT|nr:N-acetylmuramoyl-L-alanine amidase [Parvularcula mediterranea]NNU16409.1 N-acetylmuramoyl-L-alanine amidase [Parvularcula mediterranea]